LGTYVLGSGLEGCIGAVDGLLQWLQLRPNFLVRINRKSYRSYVSITLAYIYPVWSVNQALSHY